MLLALALACAADPASSPSPTNHAAPIQVSERCAAISTHDGPITFYEDNPTFVDPTDHAPDMRWSTPEAEGIDAAGLEAAAAELEQNPVILSFLVMRHGAVVFERYFHGSGPQDSNNVHSSSKSILAAVVGAAVARGDFDINEPIATYLPGYFKEIDDPEERAITGRDLLTMSAGFKWTEDVSEYALEDEPDWIAAILALPLETHPGEAFNYSTAQTHLLAAALARATGVSYCDYAHEHLLDPMGIAAERWGRDPQGYFSGGYNVYLSPRELALFGQLVLDRGLWQGQPLVPSEWIKKSVDEHINTGGGYRYGYLFWLWRLPGIHADIAWGYGGQLVYTLPKQDMVVVFTTNTHDYDPDYDGGQLLVSQVLPSVMDE